jgi:mannose-6-phosphate isomerase-like protein (cupin superfamily)
MQKGDMSEDVHLRPGDLAFVPQNAVYRIKPFLPTWGLGAYVNPANF